MQLRRLQQGDQALCQYVAYPWQLLPVSFGARQQLIPLRIRQGRKRPARQRQTQRSDPATQRLLTRQHKAEPDTLRPCRRYSLCRGNLLWRQRQP